MDDTKIFRVALITTILGLSGMLLLADKVMHQELKIKALIKACWMQISPLKGLL